MDVYRTEEEQIDALKKWWSDNGNSLLIGVVIALAVIFGWKMYNQKVEARKNQESSLYQQMVMTAMKEKLSSDDKATVEFLAKKLKKDAKDSEYGVFASLFLAKSAVDEGKLDVAEKELKWSLANEKDPALMPMIKTRLARVMAAQGHVDQAIALIDKALKEENSNSFENIYLAAKGDFLLNQGHKKEAVAAYQKAFDISVSRKQQAPILKMKLESLGVLAGDA